MKPHTVSRARRRFVEANGLPKVSFHSLRHIHASILIDAGIDVLRISRRLGHSKVAITLDGLWPLAERRGRSSRERNREGAEMTSSVTSRLLFATH
jgi:integrase